MDVVNWYLEHHYSDINTVEEAAQLSKIVHSIIHRLIVQEKALVILKDDGDYKERMLELNPNLYDSQ